MSTTTLEAAASAVADPPPTLKVRDLKAHAFARVDEQFKNPKEAKDLLNYIDFLAQNNSMSADDLELPFPPDGKKLEWNLTRAEVTQLFFGHLETKAEEIKKNIVLPDEAAQAALIKLMKDRAANAVKEFKRQEENNVSSAEGYLTEFNRHMAAARNNRQQLEALTGSVDYEKRIKEVVEGLASTNWNFHKLSGDRLEFISRSDIILRHIEPKAGLHYELNCGKFRLSISTGSMTPCLLAHERCVIPGLTNFKPHIHPHVGRSGEICFGNAADSAKNAQLSGDIIKLIQIIDALLPNYGDNPFVLIKDFKAACDERDRRAKEEHGKKKEAPGTQATEDDLLDDEPEFFDDIEWYGSPDEHE